ncbi:nuclear transcription factor Y subunit gamma-like [Anopheles gambiae]|uniref:nuclear transcription factor Y subunit gamma-like n=1 Tax=Anopheles gambiae TaxID=7165 RepID=UPI002AC8DA8F|nr:nuclear transcription factor Y subunit gamma-like [Anopheles gambiae]
MTPRKKPSDEPSISQQNFTNFWPNVMREIERMNKIDTAHPVFPLSRIKRIMKIDEEVPNIAYNVSSLLAKASEIFIQELTLCAWLQTEASNRATLTRKDIAKATEKYEQFDFLMDIVPRNKNEAEKSVVDTEDTQDEDSSEEVGCTNCAKEGTSCEGPRCGFQQPEIQPRNAESAAEGHDDTVTHVIPIVVPHSGTGSTDEQVPINQTLQLFLQIITPTGEISHVPITIPQDNLTITEVVDPEATPNYM